MTSLPESSFSVGILGAPRWEGDQASSAAACGVVGAMFCTHTFKKSNSAIISLEEEIAWAAWTICPEPAGQDAVFDGSRYTFFFCLTVIFFSLSKRRLGNPEAVGEGPPEQVLALHVCWLGFPCESHTPPRAPMGVRGLHH